jgi:sulfite reductase alpha subunit-like flavoprotein
MNNNAHVYICGSLKMAVGVTEKLKQIFQKEGNLTKEVAEKLIEDLKVRRVL